MPKKPLTPIYPEIQVEVSPQRIGIQSLVRKKDTEGVWYTTLHHKEVWFGKDDDREKEIIFMMKRFTIEAYVDLTLGQVDKNLKFGIEQEPAYTKDADQRDEAERILSLIP